MLSKGYDKEKEVFNCRGYSRLTDSTGIESGYDTFIDDTLSFEDLKKAYNEARPCYEGSPQQFILLIRQKNSLPEYRFDFQRFIKQMNNYINSRGFHELQNAIGFNVYEKLEACIQGMIGDETEKVDSRAFFIIHEHKQLFLNALQFIHTNNIETKNILSEIIAEYEKRIVNRSKVLFYQFLQYEYKTIKNRDYDDYKQLIPVEKGSDEDLMNKKSLGKILESVRQFRTIEFTLVNNIFNQLTIF